MATQPVHTLSPNGSPEGYHNHRIVSSGSDYSNKNTYRHIPGHSPGINTAQGYQSMMINSSGIPYSPHMSVPVGQYYAPNPAAGAGYMPVYNGAAVSDHHQYYYYPPGINWATAAMQVQGQPMAVYSPHGYSGSPPSTPPQPPMMHGFPVPSSGHEYVPPSPPQPQFHHQHHNHAVPALEHRRNSWSSSGATETPTTPFPTTVDPVPVIVGEQGNSDSRNVKDMNKHVESLILAGPPLPRPIPAIYAPSVSTLAQTLDNPTNTTNVYIRGLPPDTDDDKLYEMTCRFGSVVSHKAIMDTEHGTCKGYGFARYETNQEAEDCIRGLVSLKYEAGFARESFNARLKTLADPNSTNIYVSNLPRSMTEKDMQEIFTGYTVVSNRILRDVHGNSRGVGFARFESRSICNEIIKKFHGMPVGEEALALQVRYADTSAQKRLKATTTKKRQFRSNEYNSMVNSGYYQNASYGNHSHYRNRVWLRQNHMGSHGEMISNRKNWDRSQDWKSHGEENRDWSWRNTSAELEDAQIKLETVIEDDDSISETRSETGTAASMMDHFSMMSIGRASSGSASDPGDSYGGREYARCRDDSCL